MRWSPVVHLRFPRVSPHRTRLAPPRPTVMHAERTIVSIVEGFRRSLPMADHVRGKRLAATCQYKCANACLGPECNSSHNETFQEVAAAALSRRALLGLGAAGAVAIAVGGLRQQAPLSAPGSAGVGGAGAAFARPAGGSLPFDAIAPVTASVDDFVVPDGYTLGSRSSAGATRCSRRAAPSTQRPRPPRCRRCSSATTTTTSTSSPTRAARPACWCQPRVHATRHHVPAVGDPAELDGAATSHGGARACRSSRSSAASARARRGRTSSAAAQPPHHGRDPVRVDRPGRGLATCSRPSRTRRAVGARHARQLRRRHDAVGHGPLGRGELQRLLPCAGDERRREALRSHVPTSTGRGWENIDPRFDARNPGYRERAEPLRLDRRDRPAGPDLDAASSTPRWAGSSTRARTSSSAEDGHVVAYMGDDERNDYLYKFVSKNKIATVGGLAREEQDAAERGRPVRREVLGRLAGRRDHRHRRAAVGRRVRRHRARGSRSSSTAEPGRRASRPSRCWSTCDSRRMPSARPRWTAARTSSPTPRPARSTSRCTNNTSRSASVATRDEANPRTNNRDGHVIEMTETATADRHDLRLEHPAAVRRPRGERDHLLRGLPEGARSRRSRAPTTSRSTPRATSGSRPTARRA